MLGKIIEWCINNKFIVIVVTLVVVGWGSYSMYHTPVDAIPDLSDVQVIIYTEYPGQAPRIVEDQVTYPLTTKMLAVPFARVVRGYDGTDMYWARSRVLEYLSTLQSQLPRGVTPQLGPDATGLGWVYEYTLQSPDRSLQELRSIQDWYLKYELTSVDGVAEVASIGGYVKQYQVTVDPNKLQSYKIPLSQVRDAIRKSNNDVGGRLLEFAESEYMVRGLGYIRNIEDVKDVSLGSTMDGTPIYLKDIADVTLGPELRRGLAEWDGQGEAVGGIVVMRFGENALATINRVKAKLAELKAGLPDDVHIIPAYNRSSLIERAISNLRDKLLEEGIVVSLVILLFLLHFRSSFVAIITLPVAVLMAFIVMHAQGINANIMSLGGIAIAIGAMVDAAIIMIENAHKHIEHEELLPPENRRSHWLVITESAKEVGPSLFYSLLVITVSFIPIFTLEQQEGRLFKPLAFTKTYAMGAAAILAITLVPVLMGFFIRGKIKKENENPINRWIIKAYRPLNQLSLKYKWWFVGVAVVLMLSTLFPFAKIGSEFMPPLYEGDLLYMPTTLPGISVTKAREILQQTDKIIKTFPEVDHVFGKIGRAETATDPAPLTMIETTIQLKPEEEWRDGMTVEKLVQQLNDAIQFPGVTNAWTMPIKTRIDMLSTGIKTPVGIKISGPDLKVLEDLGRRVEGAVKTVDGTLSAYAERVMGGNYIDYEIRRKAIARYGLTVQDVQDVIMSAVGGMNITTTVEGLERYPVNLRYQRDYRENMDALRRVLVPIQGGGQVPLGELADIKIKKGPPGIKSENSRPNAWVYVDLSTSDIGDYVKRAQKVVAEKVQLPAGYNIVWSGQYEYMQHAEERLLMVIPVTLLIVFFLIYLNTRSVQKTFIVLLAVPFSLVGAFWYLYFAGYNLSIAVWVGIIALAGVDAETGVVMLLYLDLAYEEWKRKGLMFTVGHLKDAIYHGAVQRVRPKLMTVSVLVAGLMPILWSTGAGSDVMKRIAAPMVGGIVTSFIMELLIYPSIYLIWREWKLRKQLKPEGLEEGNGDLARAH